ncbi:hypothetical protein P168DRAFT_328046 [Aspergillus campestris IBT 28561]|uniref:Dienelactone hydrolase n=1 Tax=Aspergillus campestris (strain IBT 28561) TaxID=1392248 RepID=A0A2I1CZ95_ASPC2|nr:uncharacterized protein P168DRAFT_328046 [Aspergillus campestris IBT 28561]PKY02944.1 hypothetical protein P168DRAFT_328046 [Aspergillus campestris IBT 28561]
MNRLREHFRRRSSSNSTNSTQPLSKSPTLNPADKRRRSTQTSVHQPPVRRLYVTSSSQDFDTRILHRFQAEGFKVEYLPFVDTNESPEKNRKELEKLLNEREDDLEPGEKFAVVAYNRPAYHLLCSHHQSTTSTNPFPRLCALATYYPDIPAGQQDWLCPYQTNASSPPPTVFPASTTSTATASSYDMLSLLPIQIHLPGQQKPSLWDDYSTHPLKKRHRCHLFFYPESEAGFAESTSSSGSPSSYDAISARLAWTRSLECLKRGFGWPGSTWTTPDIEDLWEQYWRKLQETPRGQDPTTNTDGPINLTLTNEEDFDTDTDTPVPKPRLSSTSSGPPPLTTTNNTEPNLLDLNPHIDCSPTMLGGAPSQKMRLLSRTVGVDRVVDELLLTFTHTEEIPWMLPGVPPTGKDVRVLLVMTGSFVGGRMARLGVYWDQAGVLVQVGLLDPMLVPGGFRAIGRNRRGSEGVERLPVVGVEGVERMLEE